MYFNRLSQIAEPEVQTEGSTRRFDISYQNIETIAGCLDIAVIVLASVFGGALYQYLWFGQSAGTEANLAVGIANSLLYVYVAGSRGLYRLPVLLEPSRYLGRIFVTWAVVGLFVTAFLFLLKGETEFSHGSMVSSAALQIVLLLLARWVAAKTSRSMMATGSLAGRRVVTVGEPEELARLSTAVLFRYFGLNEVARISVGANQGFSPDDVLIDLDRALHEAREHGVDEFVVALRWSSKDLLETVRNRLRASPLPVRLLPDHTIRSVLGRRALSTSGPMLSLELQRAPLTPVERAFKRALDIVFASMAILLLSPLLAITAIVIKLDSPGPVIFRQRRNGFNTKPFIIFKFRTMTVLEDGATIKQARRGDHRVTRVGQLLRRSSIDELPQLFNVLQGDMSLVGPRPHALAHDNEYKVLISKYSFRHHVKPGMTGWAQVNGLRGETGRLDQMVERVKLDLWYVNHWSFGLDLSILLRTCFEVMRNRAY
ncbi:undecaprenyl-phosphate glucose phosphotransferase [Methylocapsa aurea]|uniref:undecaprenyl-phosphate glucose phosphotransferase n=1 Tax=Methylocapsa aurea TaxID=663610 RepID=UPI000560C031|nr:undecaprenyl-phosphate glucose phosphotransferase [Methylocapsa aurea]